MAKKKKIEPLPEQVNLSQLEDKIREIIDFINEA